MKLANYIYNEKDVSRGEALKEAWQRTKTKKFYRGLRCYNDYLEGMRSEYASACYKRSLGE